MAEKLPRNTSESDEAFKVKLVELIDDAPRGYTDWAKAGLYASEFCDMPPLCLNHVYADLLPEDPIIANINFCLQQIQQPINLEVYTTNGPKLDEQLTEIYAYDIASGLWSCELRLPKGFTGIDFDHQSLTRDLRDMQLV